MNADWTIFLTIAGLLFGLIVSLHFLLVKRPGIAIRWLGLYTFVITMSLAEFIIPENSRVLIFFGGLTFLYGPFLLLYIKSRMVQSMIIERKEYIHFISFISYITLVITFSSASNSGESSGIIELIVYELLFIQIFWYCIAGLRMISRKKDLLTKESDPDLIRMQISFLRILVVASMILFLTSYAATHVFMFTGYKMPFEFKYAIQIGLCVLIFVIALLNTETMYAKKLIKAY
jgi:hypothetical protein